MPTLKQSSNARKSKSGKLLTYDPKAFPTVREIKNRLRKAFKVSDEICSCKPLKAYTRRALHRVALEAAKAWVTMTPAPPRLSPGPFKDVKVKNELKAFEFWLRLRCESERANQIMKRVRVLVKRMSI